MSDLREFFDSLIFLGIRRFTQQSPVMPDVWHHFGLRPTQQQDLLFVSDWKSTPATLAAELKQRLLEDRKKTPEILHRDPGRPPKIAYNQSAVAAKLWFEEVVRAALPLSGWWRKHLVVKEARDEEDCVDPLSEFRKGQRAGKQFRSQLVKCFCRPAQTRDLRFDLGNGKEARFTEEMLWLAQIVGTIAYISRSINGGELEKDPIDLYQTPSRRRSLMDWLERLREPSNDNYPADEIVESLFRVFAGMAPVDIDRPPSLYIINRNRTTNDAIAQSTSAIKADAARTLFDITGKNICWAVLDSGIDAEHLAFRKRDLDGVARTPAFQETNRRVVNHTRIRGTYSFIHIRDLLSLDIPPNGSPKQKKAEVKRQLEMDDLGGVFNDLDRLGKLDDLIKALELQQGPLINWSLLAPVIEIPHEKDKYDSPAHPHGTHVAGIIGADWRRGDKDDARKDAEPSNLEAGQDRIVGICPDIELYDLRVLNGEGVGDEFSIMSALQFARYLNDRHDYVEVHGVNLSFSIEHDVSNYACGRTPVCEECERLVGNGIVVVAAAGNSGRARYLRPDGFADEGFRTVSITDPGNAQAVITVGATHRIEPHTYGVSYFSSRGPTGDGRLKPDLVAPGEKILSTIPGNRSLYLDGTSMAAPHVSGAAALLMARNYEFIKRPDQIKKVLCQSATDLGRERYFQGAGLLDILRALQTV